MERYLGSQYELVEIIGAGSMGEVWRARRRADAVPSDGAAQPELAAKLLRPDLATDADVVRRFIQERAVLMSLEHPGIVRVFDMVAEGDHLAIVMELVPGGTLAQALAEAGTLSPAVAVPVVCAVLDALSYAHGKGVLHRDVKPANVLLGLAGAESPATVKLSDFGIASFTDEHGVHATGLVGSPAYMPPELFTAGTVSAASDVYATGVMLYELLAGRTPFAGSGTAQTVGFRHVTVAPPELPLDAQLWRVIDAMLAKNPVSRPTAAGAAATLRALPPAALSPVALPVQPEPEWGAVRTIIPQPAAATPAGVVEVDVQSTRLAGSAAAKSASARENGAVKSWPATDGTGRETDINSTRLAGLVQPQVENIAEPKPSPVKAAKRRGRLILALVTAGALVLAGGTIVLLKTGVFGGGGGGGGGQTTAPLATTLVPAHLTGQDAATGLRVDYDAAPDFKANVINLTISLTAPHSTGLSGDVLVVIPPSTAATPTASDCPVVTAPDLQTATESGDGIMAVCAYKVAASLAPEATQTLNAQVTGDVGGDLSAWLQSIASQTAQALTGVTGSGFPLQRVSGLTVEADTVSRTQATPEVQYRVFAQWSDGQAELFRNDTLDFQATDLLESLTGGAGFDKVTVTSCPETQVRGIVVLADQPTDTCSIQVTIGDLASQPAQFSIEGAGS